MSNAEPAALVTSVLAGDGSAWLALWHAVEPKLYTVLRRPSFLGRLSDSEGDCRTIVTDVMARLQADDFERLRAYAEARGANLGLPFLAWLLVVTKRVAIDYIRAHRENVDRPSEPGASPPGVSRVLDTLTSDSRALGESAHMANPATTQEILARSDDVPAPERDALKAWLTGRSYAEIAVTHGFADEKDAEQAVRAALERLRDRFRAERVTPLSCAQAEVLLAARAVGSDPSESPGLVAHLTACDACMRLAREIENPVVMDALAEACEANADVIDLTVVPRGHYLRGKEIGRGGMGRIVRARDRRLGRSVAIKELLDERLRARFEREARLTARLQHPAIVSVHEAGRWSSGEPFYAMKYVAGKPLHNVIAEKSTLAERLTLLPNLITVVEAMAYAHSERVIHRDLKPGNILVGAFGETVVIDWGIAKDLASLETGDAPGPYRAEPVPFTVAGAGTPEYMPPEQTRGEAPDERADVFALGATLHHLLAGAPPRKAPLPNDTPTELRTIVAKATAPDRVDRYPTAAELAEELKRFQTGQLVSAHRYTFGELARRWLRRHRALVRVGGGAAAFLAVFALVAIGRIVRERAVAEQTTGELLGERGRQELLGGQPARALAFLDGALQHGVDTPTVRFLTAEATRSLGRLVDSFSLGSHVVRVVPAPDGTRLLVTYDDARARLVELASHRVLEELPAPAGTVIARFAQDGSAFLVAGCTTAEQATIRNDDEARDAATCGRTAIVSRGGVHRALVHGHRIADAEFAADGRSVAILTGDAIHVWGDSDDAKPRLVWKPPGELQSAAINAHGDVIAAATSDSIRLWEGGAERTLVRHLAPCGNDTGSPELMFDPAGQRVVASTMTQACAWDLRTGALVAHADPKLGREPTVAHLQMDFSSDRAWLATFNTVSGLQLWRGDTFAAGPTILETIGVENVAFAPGGLVTASPDGTARIWDLRGVELARYEGSGRALKRVWLTADATRLVAWDADNVVRVWDASRRLRGPVLPRMTESSLPYLGDGRMLFVSLLDGSVQLWDRNGAVAALPGPGARGKSFRVARPSPDGSRVLVGEPDGRLVRWDPVTGVLETLVQLAKPPRAWLTARGERWVAASDGEWTIYSADGRRLISLPDVFRHGAILSADDGRMAAIVEDEARVWDLTSGRQTATLRLDHMVARVVVPRWVLYGFSPDGATLAWRGSTARLHLADVVTGAERATVADEVRGELFAPDGARVLTFDRRGVAALWTANGEALASYEVRQTVLSTATVAFSPDGRLIAIGCSDGVVRVWDGDVLVQTTALGGTIRRVAFSPDGEELFAADDGAGWRWSVSRDRRGADEIHAFVGARVPFMLNGSKITLAPERAVRPEPTQPRLDGALGPAVTAPCPPGAAPFGAPFPSGRAAWCVRPDGVMDGPLRVWNAAGQLVLDEAFAEGHRVDGGSVEIRPPRISIGGHHLATRTPWIVRDGMSVKEYENNVEAFARDGYRITDVAGYNSASGVKYAAIWMQGPTAAYEVRHDLTADEYQRLFQDEVTKGFRPVHVSGYENDGIANYAAVFREGRGKFIERHDLTLADCEKVFAENKKAGYLPVDVAVYQLEGSTRFAAIWEKSNEVLENYVDLLMSPDHYQRTVDRLSREGFALRSVSGYPVGTQPRYAAIFAKMGPLGWRTRHGMRADEYQKTFDDVTALGLVPERIDVFEVGGNELFAGIWVERGRVDKFPPAQRARLDRLIKDAEDAAKSHNWVEARSKAAEALEMEPDNRQALTVAVLAACYAGDKERAHVYATRIKDLPRHNMLKQICAQNGITID